MSYGKERIEKIATFTSLPGEDYFALTFGDLRKDGSFNTYANSNNGDMLKVLTTIINIIKEFADERPFKKVFFTGSTPTRTALYHRILKNNHTEFSNNFIITALIKERNGIKELAFDPASPAAHLGFFIMKK